MEAKKIIITGGATRIGAAIAKSLAGYDIDITVHYNKDDLIGRQVMAVVNFPPRQIGPFMSEVLVLGFADEKGDIILAGPDRNVPNGQRMC